MKKYKIIYADPPWAYRNMGNIQATANAQYPTMQNEDICKLLVKEEDYELQKKKKKKKKK